MKIRPVLRSAVPAYPAIAVAAFAAASAFAAEKPVPLHGKPAPPKAPAVQKPPALLGDVAAPLTPIKATEDVALKLGNTTFVSAASLAEWLGVKVGHQRNSSVWALQLGRKNILLKAGQSTATANGKQLNLPAPPMVLGVSLRVPVRTVCQALGITVVRRGADTALSTANGKMLILKAPPLKPMATTGVVAAPQPLQGTPAPPAPPKR